MIRRINANDPAGPILRVALGEYDTGWHSPQESLLRAGALIQRAAADNADLIILPEMCTTGFTMEPESWAEPLDGESVSELSELAAAHRINIIAGVATDAIEDGEQRFYNSALWINRHGDIAAEYRKQRLFRLGSEYQIYTPGDRSVVIDVEGVRIALFICFDIRFPDLFSRVAPVSDAMIIIANWPIVRRAHWDVLLHARAIENQCYVIGVNRTGIGGDRYDGGSVAYGPWGERLTPAFTSKAHAESLLMSIEPTRVASVRERYPFLPAAQLHLSVSASSAR